MVFNFGVVYPYYRKIGFPLEKALPLSKKNQYHQLINSKANNACPSLVISIFPMKDSSYTIVNGMALLQYHITSGEEQVDFHVGVHGKSSKY